MQGFESSCDLHIHSHYSDGNLSPEEIVRRAASSGLSAISITDHDTLRGQKEALIAGEKYGIEVLCGVEFSIREGDIAIHILGYLMDPLNEDILKSVKELEEARRERAQTMVRKLEGEGVRISFGEVAEEAGRGVMGRPHIARVLLKKGSVGGIQEAFDRYIGDGRPCYVRKKTLPLDKVISLVTDAGGVTVWAHPGNAVRNESILDLLCESGVAGLEAWHPNHTVKISEQVKAAAGRKGLICTGGSDYHFIEAMKAGIGEISVPYSTVLDLKEAAHSQKDI